MVSPRSAQIDEQTPPYTARMLREDPLAYFDFNDLPAPRRTSGALDTQGREDAALLGGEPVAVGIPTGDALSQLALSVMVRPIGEEVSRAEVLRYEVDGEVVVRWSVGAGGVRLEVGGQTHEAVFEIDPEDWNQLGVRITDGEVELTHQGRWTQRFELGSSVVFGALGRWSMRCEGWVCDELSAHDLPVHHTVWWQALNRFSVSSKNASSSPTLQLHPLGGHSDGVISVAYSPDGSTLATGSADDTAKVWDVGTGTLLHSLEGHGDVVISVAYSPDGSTLATASRDGSARVWDVGTGELLHSLDGHSDGVISVAYSPDGSTLATGSGDGIRAPIGSRDSTAKVWDVGTGTLLHSLEGHSHYINSVAYSPDGSTLATASFDDTAKVWDVDTGALLHSLEVHSNRLLSVAYSPDGSTLATGSIDSTAKVWDVGTGALLHSLEGHSSSVRSVAYSPDGSTLATASFDDTAKVWDVGTGALLHSLEGHSSSVRSVAYSPDSSMLATSFFDDTTKVWDVGTGELLYSLEGYSIAYSPDGSTLATWSANGIAKVWDVGTGELLYSLDGYRMVAVAYGPDGSTLTTASANGIAKVWDVGTGELLHWLEGHGDVVSSVAYSPDGSALATASRDGSARVWDVGTGELLHSLDGHPGALQLVAYGPDGSTLATMSYGPVRVWDAGTGELLHSLDGHSDDVISVAYSPDGSTLATVSFDDTAKVWDVRTGELLYSLVGHSDIVSLVAYSPDGSTLATGSHDGRMCLWNLSSQDDSPGQTGVEEPLTCLNPSLEIWLTPSGLFSAPERLDADALSVSYGTTPLSLEQLAPLYNRPDLVFERMGYDNEAHREVLRQQWSRRLELLGLDPDSVSRRAEVEPPRVLVVAEADEAGNAKVSLRAADRIGLVSYQVRVNGVPVLAGGRRYISGRRHQATHTIPLTDGANLIEVSALSTRSVESQRVSITLEHTDKIRPSLYFVGLGVSEYANPGVSDLRYAHQDVLDVASQLEATHQASGYASFERLVPDEKELTREVLAQVRAFLSQAHERDTVIVMVSGHGTYSREAAPRYFFVAHDTDPDRLTDTGIALEDLESVLATTRARERLMWMDTCASGDMADETLARVVAAGGAWSKGMRARAFRPVTTAAAAGSAPERRAREWVYQRGFIHRDLANRTGATVLSSSRGFELSWERDSWRNGAFTEALLEALSGAGDADSDGEVSLAELDAFVRARTAELTGGKQHPAVDRENPYLRLGFSAPTSSAPAR
jgi:WD40 repeat protein